MVKRKTSVVIVWATCMALCMGLKVEVDKDTPFSVEGEETSRSFELFVEEDADVQTSYLLFEVDSFSGAIPVFSIYTVRTKRNTVRTRKQ
jgi:hypothetical protein